MVQESRSVRIFRESYEVLSSDIYAFCDAMNHKPTWQQAELLDAVVMARAGLGPTEIAVKSGQGPGKTRTLCLIDMFLLFGDPYTKVILTAPTMKQCKDAFLAEVKLILKEAPAWARELFEVTGTGIGVCKQKQNEWGCLAQTATNPEGGQGQHRKRMYILVDEASGVGREHIEQYQGTQSNPNAIMILAGNPNTPDCYFYDCFNSKRHLWKTITWNAEETPESEWFTRARNEKVAEEYGRNSDVYRVRVQGEFPLSAPNCVISGEELHVVMDRKRLVAMSRINPLVRRIAMDLARFGGDESTIYRRHGNAILEDFKASRMEPTDVVGQSFVMQGNCGWTNAETEFVVDATGMGQGVLGLFRSAGKRVIEFHNGGKATKAMYANKITQAWFEMGALVKQGICCVPNDPQLHHQLSTRRYHVNVKGQLILEEKKEYVKRHEISPDRADGCVMAYHGSSSTQSVFEGGLGGGRKVGAR